MNIRQTMQTAVKTLFANKARCLHALLGMVIGVGGFVLALSCANLSFAYIGMQNDEYDEAVLLVSTYVSADLPVRVQPQEMERLAAANPQVIRGISPYVKFDLPGGVKYGEQSADEAQVYGVNGSFMAMLPVLRLREGRFLADMDISRESKVCVIGSRLADDMLGGDALGQTLRIWGENFTVIGVFAEVEMEIERKRNSEVYIPYTNALKMAGENISEYNNYDNKYYVCANGTENMYDTQVLIKELLQQRTGREEKNGWRLNVTSMGCIEEMLNGYVIAGAVQQSVFAGIVLLIGGVGIMNVMLAGVQARTKEIGIRKAFGATAGDIQRQFALEAVVTSLIGGAAGVICGLAGMLLLCRYANVPLHFLGVSGLPVLAALGVTVLVGVLFGTYPARQAAKMEIVDAINEG